MYRVVVVLATLITSLSLSLPVSAETIFGALAKAYENNANLNAQRAGLRVTDEDVPIAKSGMRPTIVARGTISQTSSSSGSISSNLTAGSFGVFLSQSIFDGFQTRNNVRAAEAGVRAARENLRNTEQNTLFDAASAYMDVILFRQIARLRQQNLEFLSEQMRAARSRFEVGEGTRTDVAQAEASYSAAQAQLTAARAQVTSAEAIYQQIIGARPDNLDAASPLTKLLPASLDSAYARAQAEHPAILATNHAVDASSFQVKSAEGALRPALDAEIGVELTHQHTSPGAVRDGSGNNATIGATLTIPIYQGGLASSIVRQSKESLGQARINVDVSRDQVRAAVASAWTQYEAARQNVLANRELVSALRLALEGVMAERDVGQRTTLDVLNAQADVIDAQIALAASERDGVVASYAIASATGRLSAAQLGLQTRLHDPREHYHAVRDKWYGLRTPDGR